MKLMLNPGDHQVCSWPRCHPWLRSGSQILPELSSGPSYQDPWPASSLPASPALFTIRTTQPGQLSLNKASGSSNQPSERELFTPIHNRNKIYFHRLFLNKEVILAQRLLN